MVFCFAILRDHESVAKAFLAAFLNVGERSLMVINLLAWEINTRYVGADRGGQPSRREGSEASGSG